METQYSHLLPEERSHIEVWLKQGWSCRRVAKQLNRSCSTVSRELKRGHWDRLERYSSFHGELHYKAGRIRAGHSRRKLPVDDQNSPLWKFCLRMLGRRLSPEQISGMLRHCAPLPPTADGPAPFVCTQSIYTALHSMPHSPTRNELTRCLRHSTGGRRYKRRTNPRLSPIQNFTSISQRPAEIDLGSVPGHLEGDLMVGAKGKSFLGVIVERTSLRTWLVKLDNAQAAHVREQFAMRLRSMPRKLRRSMTYDRGWEMAQHQQLTHSLDMPIYFCDAYSPWQRGLVENTNGLLRQYFPKGTDFSTVTPERLLKVERELNNRPRKTHRFKSATQIYAELRLQTLS